MITFLKRGQKNGTSGVSRSVSFASIGARLVQVLNGFVSLLFVSQFLTVVEQGYYFTFIGLATMYTLVELGLGSTLVYYVGHEWRGDADWKPDEIVYSRLRAIATIAAIWYSVATALILLGLVGAGVGYFGTMSTTVNWFGPWVFLSVCIVLEVMFLPFWSLMEGIRRLNYVYSFRLFRAVAMAVGTWGALLAGGGLWAVGTGYAAEFVVAVGFAAAGVPRMRSVFLRGRSDWGLVKKVAAGIWSMQSRTAINAILSYFSTWAVTPICMRIFGAADAGRIGMTFAIAMAVAGLANSVIIVRASAMSMLAANKRYHDLDREVLEMILLSCGLVILAIVALPLGLRVLALLVPNIVDRMQPVGLTAIVLLGVAMNQVAFCLAVYMRAHRIEPMVPVSIGNAVLFIGILALFGSSAGPIIAPLAYTAVIGLFALPLTLYIFFTLRRRWLTATFHDRVLEQEG